MSITLNETVTTKEHALELIYLLKDFINKGQANHTKQNQKIRIFTVDEVIKFILPFNDQNFIFPEVKRGEKNAFYCYSGDSGPRGISFNKFNIQTYYGRRPDYVQTALIGGYGTRVSWDYALLPNYQDNTNNYEEVRVYDINNNLPANLATHYGNRGKSDLNSAFTTFIPVMIFDV